jgi:hypothetical protein
MDNYYICGDDNSQKSPTYGDIVCDNFYGFYYDYDSDSDSDESESEYGCNPTTKFKTKIQDNKIDSISTKNKENIYN